MSLYRVVERSGQKTLDNLAGATRGEGCPLGSIITYYSDTLPNENWLFCDGSTFDTTKYPALYLLLGDDKVPNMNKIIRYDYENPQTFPGNGEINWTATSDGLFYPFPYANSGNAYSASITINGETYNDILSQANSNYNNTVFELKKGDVIRMYGTWSSRTNAVFIPAITCNCIIKATSNMSESESAAIIATLESKIGSVIKSDIHDMGANPITWGSGNYNFAFERTVPIGKYRVHALIPNDSNGATTWSIMIHRGDVSTSYEDITGWTTGWDVLVGNTDRGNLEGEGIISGGNHKGTIIECGTMIVNTPLTHLRVGATTTTNISAPNNVQIILERII